MTSKDAEEHHEINKVLKKLIYKTTLVGVLDI